MIKIGKTIATVNVEIRNKLTGRLVASGRHMKFIAGKQQGDLDKDNPESDTEIHSKLWSAW